MGENQVEDLFVGKPANKAPTSFWRKRRSKFGAGRNPSDVGGESDALQYKESSVLKKGKKGRGRSNEPAVEEGFSLVHLSDDDSADSRGDVSSPGARQGAAIADPERVSNSDKLVILD